MYSEYYTEENGHKIDAEKYADRNRFDDSNTILKSTNKKTPSNTSFIKLDIIQLRNLFDTGSHLVIFS